jgi:hypothetical protein
MLSALRAAGCSTEGAADAVEALEAEIWPGSAAAAIKVVRTTARDRRCKDTEGAPPEKGAAPMSRADSVKDYQRTRPVFAEQTTCLMTSHAKACKKPATLR